MSKIIKNTIMVGGGMLCLLLAIAFGFFLIQYVVGGAGWQEGGIFLFGTSILAFIIGLAHFSGLAAACGLSFAIGVGLCAHGLVPSPDDEGKPAKSLYQRLKLIRRLLMKKFKSSDKQPILRCVCCNVPVDNHDHICADCGWTQPHHQNQA